MFQAQNRETKLVLEKLLCPPRSLWRRAWQDCISQHNTKPAKTKTDFFWSQTGLVLKPTVSDHITGLGKRCELPSQWGSGGALTAQDVSLFSALRMASPDTIILYYCGSLKDEKFLTGSILSRLLCTWWCCLIFLGIRD